MQGNSERTPWFLHLATLWCLLFAALHTFWGLGGSVGLASSAGRDLAERRPASFVIFGLYGVALVLLVGVGLLRIAVNSTPGRGRSVVIGVLALIGGMLLVRGMTLELLLWVNVGDIRTEVGPLETYWSQVLWNPWFVLGGVLFLLTSVQLRRQVDQRGKSR